MGCNCGGSSQVSRPAKPGEPFRRQPQQTRERRQLAKPPTIREGGPGSPSYYSRSTRREQ